MITEAKMKELRGMLLSANQYNADGATQVAQALLLNVVGELLEDAAKSNVPADLSKAPAASFFEHGQN